LKSSAKTQTLILQGIHEKLLSENPKKIFKNYCFCQTSLKREFTVRALSTLWDKLAKVLIINYNQKQKGALSNLPYKISDHAKGI